METNTLHPLVVKKAAEWAELAAKYGVKTELRPLDSHWTGGATIDFETSYWFERGSVTICPPAYKGRAVRQLPLIMGYRRTTGGKTAFRHDPGANLRRLRNQIIWSWSPTAGERLQAEAQAIRAAQARRAELKAAK